MAKGRRQNIVYGQIFKFNIYLSKRVPQNNQHKLKLKLIVLKSSIK